MILVYLFFYYMTIEYIVNRSIKDLILYLINQKYDSLIIIQLTNMNELLLRYSGQNIRNLNKL